MKITIKTEDDASHSVRATVVSTATGQEFDVQDIAAGGEVALNIEDEQRVVITRGPVTEAPADEGDTKKKSK